MRQRGDLLRAAAGSGAAQQEQRGARDAATDPAAARPELGGDGRGGVVGVVHAPLRAAAGQRRRVGVRDDGDGRVQRRAAGGQRALLAHPTAFGASARGANAPDGHPTAAGRVSVRAPRGGAVDQP
ncbi:hypothetical protein [Umezawaea sp.]|uniref:hypothetical protein n=1 Tax=Umezawaea sp. TaxID=1955258 RepID=UPI002ED00A67